MRKSREEAANTRRRIVEAASHRFRENGIAETGLSDLMQAAGLNTPGGFYKHFDSKQQLLDESLDFGFSEIVGRLGIAVSRAPTEEALDSIVSCYLSPKHRDSVPESCPLSSMGTELARLDGTSRQVAVDGLKKLISLVAKELKDAPPNQARKRATSIIATMVGGMVLSRIADTSHWSNAILSETRKAISKRH